MVWSTGTSIADDPRFAPRRLRARAARPRRHRAEPVRARRAVARPADDRLHPAGALWRSRAARHSRPPAVAVRRAPGGVGGRHLRRDRRAGRAATGPAPPRRRSGRRRRARRADVQPAAVPGDLVPDRRACRSGRCARRSCPNLHPTADGYVALQTTTGQQWLDFCTMIGRDDWYDDERLARGTYRTLHRPELEAVIEEWTSARTTAEIVELATLLRDPGGRGGQRRDPAAVPAISSTAGGSPRTRPGSCNRPCPTASGGGRRRDPSPPRPPSGATPSVTAPGRRPPARRLRTTSSVASPPRRRRCRSPAFASSTSPRSGPDRSSGTRAESSGPR